MKMKVISTEIETTIAGVTFDDPLTGINRQKLIKAYAKPGLRLQAVLEPDNPVSADAVALHFSKRIVLKKDDIHIGYVPKKHSGYIASLLREGRAVDVVVVKTIGGTKDKPTRGVIIKISY